MADLPQIYLTHNNMDRLLKLVEAQPGKGFEKLEGELVRANVLPTIPQDVVTKQSYRIVGVPFQPEAAGAPG